MNTPDPASLNVTVTVNGMGNDEASCMLGNLPVGCTATVAVTAPTIGALQKRYRIEAGQLSVKGASDVTTALFLHCQRILEEGK